MKTCEEYVINELIDYKESNYANLKQIKELEKEINDLKYQLKKYEKIVERTIAYVNEFDGEQRDYLLDLLSGDIL